MRSLLITTVVVLPMLLGQKAVAQPALSADQMIDALSSKDVAAKCPPGVVECRGIRATAPAPDAAPTALDKSSRHPARVQRTVASVGALDLSIEFPSGSSDVTPAAARLLSRLGQALSSEKLSGNRFRIEGHTDTVGDAAQNQALSEKRAASVAAFLEGGFAVPAGRLDAVGLGERDLAVATPDQTAELRNRRVRVVNLGAV